MRVALADRARLEVGEEPQFGGQGFHFRKCGSVDEHGDDGQSVFLGEEDLLPHPVRAVAEAVAQRRFGPTGPDQSDQNGGLANSVSEDPVEGLPETDRLVIEKDLCRAEASA